MSENEGKRRSPPSLIREYEEPLTPEEAWEAVTTDTGEKEEIVITGKDAKNEISKYDWEETPTLWKLLLDPRKIPCMRETMMVGIVGGTFGLGFSILTRGLIYTAIFWFINDYQKGNWNRASRHYFAGFLSIGTLHWVICSFQTQMSNKVIQKTMKNHPQIVSEKEIIRRVDKARMESDANKK